MKKKVFCVTPTQQKKNLIENKTLKIEWKNLYKYDIYFFAHIIGIIYIDCIYIMWNFQDV